MEEALRIRVVNPSFRLWPHVRTNFNIILDFQSRNSKRTKQSEFELV